MRIGIDIVDIKRIEKMSETAKKKTFTEYELNYSKKAETLAGIFAVKEAYSKALGVGLGIDFKSIEVTHNKLGQPELKGKNAQISISHDAGIAAAVVLITE